MKAESASQRSKAKLQRRLSEYQKLQKILLPDQVHGKCRNQWSCLRTGVDSLGMDVLQSIELLKAVKCAPGFQVL